MPHSRPLGPVLLVKLLDGLVWMGPALASVGPSGPDEGQPPWVLQRACPGALKCVLDMALHFLKASLGGAHLGLLGTYLTHLCSGKLQKVISKPHLEKHNFY